MPPERKKTDGDAVSPAWSSTTKLVVGLTLVALAALLIWRFSSLLPPLLMVFILVYLLHPAAAFLTRLLRVSWRAAVNIIFALIVILFAGLVALGGVGLVQQVQNLLASLQTILLDLPDYLQTLSQTVYHPFGIFTIDLRNFDFNLLNEQALSSLETIMGRTGNLVGAAASSAASFFGWALFVLAVSYFTMIESNGLREGLIQINIPGYAEDMRRLNHELGRIWNAFLRGQIFIFFLALAIYSILLPIFGVRYALGIALMAGLAKFLPYIGPFITWVVMGLVTFFQPSRPFGLDPLVYTAIVVGFTLLVDQIIDSLIVPRIMSNVLKVHPAAVLIAALIAANLLGLLGVVIAAPLLATFKLFGHYITRKLFDLDPWSSKELYPVARPQPRWLVRLRRFARTLRLKRGN